MLKRLKINNFKSLVNFEINFNNLFHAIIGPNNSGKTNLIEAINFISKLMKSIEIYKVIERMGGFDQILYFNAKEKTISFEIEIELNENVYQYEFEFSNKSILKEKLIINNQIQLESTGKGKGNAFDNVEKKFKEFSFDFRNLAINQLWDIERYKSIREFSKIIDRFKIYKLVPKMMREPSMAKKEFDPQINGEKIIQVLHSILSEDHQTYRNIVETMKSTFYEIEDVFSSIDERGMTNVEILENGFRRKFNSQQVSDGTLRFLAVLTILQLQKEYTLLCFEEPELYLHPYLLEKLIDIMKSASTQIIITTHSPEILNLLDPENIILINKIKGESRCKKLPTRPEIIQKLRNDGFLLGELWTMGEFDNA